MFKGKSTQKRSLSAGSYLQKKHRILSAKPLGKKNQRIHTQSYDPIYESVKPTQSRLLTSGMQHGSKYVQKSSKAPEQLFEENAHLKQQLNDLNTKLNLTRTKIQSQKKKHLLYSRKLNRQFEKQLYWSSQKGHDYLITGIKHQYQKVKQTLQQKCNQLQMAKQTISYTSIEELTAYCESLQVQNKILIQNICYLKQQKRKKSTFQENNSVSQFAQADLQYLINEERKKDQKNKSKIKSLQEHINKQTNNQKQHTNKILFLQKLIIEKENQCYHMVKKMKTIERQKNKLINQLKTFETKFLEREQQNQSIFNEIKEKAERQAKVQKAIFQKAIKQKTVFTEKLQKEIAYLSTLLTYWKPLDELDRLDINNSSMKSQKDKTISLNINQSISLHGTTNREMVRSKTPLNLSFYEQNTSNDERFLIRTSQKEDMIFNRDSSLPTIQRQESDKFSKGENSSNREPRRSTKKWSQYAKKKRIVEFTQIQHLGQLLRFKMIAAQKALKDAREYFTCKIPKGSCTKLEQELITMQQVKQTLRNPPFNLFQQEAEILSRYIVQDQGVQYVYCHEGNELQRSIVKSIVKTVIGDYDLPNLEKAQQKWKQIKKIYSHNMQLALKSICPKGLVSKNKFLELMNSLGIQPDDETKNYAIAKMVQNSTSLKALAYDLLFEPHQRIN